jgi:host factor-I protein
MSSQKGVVVMAKSPFNIQDQYLNQARKERVLVDIAMMSGDKLQGYIKSFDSFCVLVDANGDLLLYKHAITSITSTDGTFRLHGGRD